MITQDKHQPDFGNLLSTLSSALVDYSTNVATLIQYTSAPIESEEEVLERAKVMDQMMDTAKHENDIVLVFVNAILNGKREVNLNQAKGFANYFGLPIDRFIAV